MPSPFHPLVLAAIAVLASLTTTTGPRTPATAFAAIWCDFDSAPLHSRRGEGKQIYLENRSHADVAAFRLACVAAQDDGYAAQVWLPEVDVHLAAKTDHIIESYGTTEDYYIRVWKSCCREDEYLTLGDVRSIGDARWTVADAARVRPECDP